MAREMEKRQTAKLNSRPRRVKLTNSIMAFMIYYYFLSSLILLLIFYHVKSLQRGHLFRKVLPAVRGTVLNLLDC